MLIISLQHINEKPQVIQEYEQGKAVPNQNVLGKIERAIGECRTWAVVERVMWIVIVFLHTGLL